MDDQEFERGLYSERMLELTEELRSYGYPLLIFAESGGMRSVTAYGAGESLHITGVSYQWCAQKILDQIKDSTN